MGRPPCPPRPRPVFSVESERALPFHAAMHIGGSPADDELYGGVGDDPIWGGRGYDRLDGDGGDGSLIGGLGADALIGGPGVDTADYSSATSRAVNISLGTGATWSDSDGWLDDPVGDTFSSIENLVGTKFNSRAGAGTTGSSAAPTRTRSSAGRATTTCSGGGATTCRTAGSASTT